MRKTKEFVNSIVQKTLERLEDLRANFLDSVCGYIFLVLFVAVGVISGVFFLSQGARITLLDMPCKVYVKEQLVFEGKKYQVYTETGGDTTKVTIYGGFMYVIPQEYIIDKNIRVIAKRK